VSVITQLSVDVMCRRCSGQSCSWTVASIHRVKWHHNNLWSHYDLCVVGQHGVLVKFSGEDLLHYSNKVESCGLKMSILSVSIYNLLKIYLSTSCVCLSTMAWLQATVCWQGTRVFTMERCRHRRPGFGRPVCRTCFQPDLPIHQNTAGHKSLWCRRRDYMRAKIPQSTILAHPTKTVMLH